MWDLLLPLAKTPDRRDHRLLVSLPKDIDNVRWMKLPKFRNGDRWDWTTVPSPRLTVRRSTARPPLLTGGDGFTRKGDGLSNRLMVLPNRLMVYQVGCGGLWGRSSADVDLTGTARLTGGRLLLHLATRNRHVYSLYGTCHYKRYGWKTQYMQWSRSIRRRGHRCQEQQGLRVALCADRRNTDFQEILSLVSDVFF